MPLKVHRQEPATPPPVQSLELVCQGNPRDSITVEYEYPGSTFIWFRAKRRDSAPATVTALVNEDDVRDFANALLDFLAQEA